MHRNILDIFNECGVQIMPPAYVGDPVQARIVSEGRWYSTRTLTSLCRWEIE